MDLAEADQSRFLNSLLILKFFLLWHLHVFVRRICLPGYFYSTSSKNSNNIKSSLPLDPNWVTGFTDAEGYFTVKTYKSKAHSFGWRIQPEFGIGLHKKDEALLQRIQKYFGVGTIYTDRDYVVYAVRSYFASRRRVGRYSLQNLQKLAEKVILPSSALRIK